MISYQDITKLFSVDLKGKLCIEIEFSVNGFLKYQSCWMGKMPDRTVNNKEIYWYGLLPDGTGAYDFDDFHDFSTAPVFDGNSLERIWPAVKILSIDGCEPRKRICSYLQSMSN